MPPAYPGRNSQKDVALRLEEVQENVLPGLVQAINEETERLEEIIGDEGTDFNALVLSILT